MSLRLKFISGILLCWHNWKGINPHHMRQWKPIILSITYSWRLPSLSELTPYYKSSRLIHIGLEASSYYKPISVLTQHIQKWYTTCFIWRRSTLSHGLTLKKLNLILRIFVLRTYCNVLLMWNRKPTKKTFIHWNEVAEC